MKGNYFGNISFFFLLFLLVNISSHVFAQEIDDNLFVDESFEQGKVIADPLEPLNRLFFQFNDKLYFWVLKPVARSYTAVVHKDITIGVANIFRNLLAPIRIVNNLLQGKFYDSGIEFSRFVINSTLGMGGLADQAQDTFGLKAKSEDFGQTLGTYGAGEGIYICWPLFGPSNIRDTFGIVGDAFLNPLTYLSLSDSQTGWAVQVTKIISDTSQAEGTYEDFKESSFDSYTAMRDFYTQSRRSKIEDKDRVGLTNNRELNSAMVQKPVINETVPLSTGEPSLSNENNLNDIDRLAKIPSFFNRSVLDSLMHGTSYAATEKSGLGSFL